MNTLRLLPNKDRSTTVTHVSERSLDGATDLSHEAYAVHDTFRHGPRSIRSELLPNHPLETTVDQWEELKEARKMTMLKQIYGFHAPFRHQMEKSILNQIQTRLPCLPTSRCGLDVLQGRDEIIEFEDVLNDPSVAVQTLDVHSTAEMHRLGFDRPL